MPKRRSSDAIAAERDERVDRTADAPALRAPSGPDSAALGAFLSSLAHDLRSPLGVLSQTIAELGSDFADRLTDEHRLLITLAERGLHRIGRIADKVNVVGALGSTNFVLYRQEVDLVALVRAAAATAAMIEPRRQVELICELPEVPCRAMGDEPRLSYALSELVINAIRHARSAARVRLEIASGQARVIIEDDGEGLTQEARANLFRRFVPGRSHSGMGVGLSTADGVVAAHDGTITLEPSSLPPGRRGTVGARFVVVLPTANDT